jgi:hypothetical protein
VSAIQLSATATDVAIPRSSLLAVVNPAAAVSAEKESFTRDYRSLPPMKCPWRNARSRDKQ